MDMHMDMPGMAAYSVPSVLGNITEFSLNWPGPQSGSTHELVISDKYVYVTGQKMDRVAKVDLHGTVLQHYAMPPGSGPHGILLDKQQRLWVSLEFACKVVRLDDNGIIVESIDVSLHATDAKAPINTAPHGITLGADGQTIWFTGKRTSTVGKINPDRTVEHFELGTLAALPIFLSAGPDGNVWGTELFGSAILRVTPAGDVREFTIPTLNSRPIAIIPDPLAKCMWFTEEAGVKIGRIAMDGTITEYPVPALQKNQILASLAFDAAHNLWVQVYVDHNNPLPGGTDYIIRFDKAIRDVKGPDLTGVPFTIHTIPSKLSMMHRIRPDHAGNLWFTEMMTDKLGKITLANS
jgi:virginiamycin B lyase